MDVYPWWSEEHKAFQKEIKTFVEEVLPIDAETRWTRQFPREIFRRIGEEGYTGAGVPKEYGGLGLGATGACIAAEGFNRMPGPGRVFVGNMLGGLRQIIEFGTEEQKQRFLPRIAKGELGAIVITEPFAGTDAGCPGSHGPARWGQIYSQREKTIHCFGGCGEQVHGLCSDQQ